MIDNLKIMTLENGRDYVQYVFLSCYNVYLHVLKKKPEMLVPGLSVSP